MKVKVNKFIPFPGFSYINLFGVIYTRNPYFKFDLTSEIHESIHTLQGKNLLWIGFYLLYFIEWICKIPVSMFCKRGRFSVLRYAYRSISFEQMAYYNQNDVHYLETADPFEWINYVFKMYKL